jgi:hypothetical protein
MTTLEEVFIAANKEEGEEINDDEMKEKLGMIDTEELLNNGDDVDRK